MLEKTRRGVERLKNRLHNSSRSVVVIPPNPHTPSISSQVTSDLARISDYTNPSAIIQKRPYISSSRCLQPTPTVPESQVPDDELVSDPLGFAVEYGWPGLKSLLELLTRIPNAFVPVASVIEEIATGLGHYETESKSREEYKRLKIELESLFDDLTTYLDRSDLPGVTVIMRNIAQEIERDLKTIKEKQDRCILQRYAEASGDVDMVLRCYRRIQRQLTWLTLNMDISIIGILDEQTTEIRLSKLPNSSAAIYRSATSDTLRRRICTPNTRVDILRELHSWAYDKDSHKIYWLNGMAGTGKTTIAYSICTELDRTRKLAASFFCSRQLPTCRDVNMIIPSIAYQLSRFSGSFRRALSNVLKEHPEAYNQTLCDQFKSLISLPLQQASDDFLANRIVVIDALDECEDKDSADRLLGVLLDNGCALPVKFFVASRPEARILDRMHDRRSECLLTELRLHELEQMIVQDDIRIYLNFELARMSISPNELENLVERSGVLFIYAATVVRYLGSDNFSRSASRLREVLGLSEGTSYEDSHEVDALYSAILRSVFNDPMLTKVDIEHTHLLLRVIVCAREPLTLDVIGKLTGMDVENVVQPTLRQLTSVLHLSETTKILTTLHESFNEYLVTKSRSHEHYFSVTQQHTRMAHTCFEFMEQPNPPFNICHLESSYVFDEDIPELAMRIKNTISDTLFYACRYWGAHITLAEPSEILSRRLGQFLQTRLLIWLEILNLKKCMSYGARTLYNASQAAGCSTENKELIQDTLQFITVLSTSKGVLRSTPHIYVSGLAFWPKERPIWKYYSRHFLGLVAICGTALNKLNLALITKIKTKSWLLCVAYSPSGAHIVSGHEDGTVCVWDAYTSQYIWESIEGHTGSVTSVAYSPDGVFIVSGSQDKTLRIWNTHIVQKISQPLKGHSAGITSVAYSSSGVYIISGSHDKTIRIWDAQRRQQILQALAGHVGSVTSVAYSPDGASVASGSYDSTIRIWNAHTGLQICNPFEGHNENVRSIVYSPDSARIASGSSDKTIRIWSAYTGHQIGQPLRVNCRVRVLAYSPDSIHVASGTESGDIHIWNTYTRQQVGLLCQDKFNFPIFSAAYSPDGARIISCSRASTSISIWNSQPTRQKITLQHDGFETISCVAYTSDGAGLVSGSGKNLYIWSTQTGQRTCQPLRGHSDGVCSVACSPDGARVVSGSWDGTIRIWDICTGQQICQPLQGLAECVRSVVFSPDGSRIASGSDDKAVRIWCSYTGQQIGSGLKGHTNSISSVSCSQDGTRIASGSEDETVRIWDVRTGKQVGEPLKGHIGPIYSVAYSQDCTRIISASKDRTMRTWDIATGQLVGRPLVGHTSYVESVACSPDGVLIASGSGDKTVRVWNASSGQQIGNSLKGHTDRVTSVAFTHCGKYLASGSDDGTIRIWVISTIQASQFRFIDHLALPSQQPLVSKVLSLTPLMSAGPACLSSEHELRDRWTLREDGWVVIDGHKLIIWVPSSLHDRLVRPQNSLVISDRGWLQLEFGNAKLGERWTECYKASIER